MTAPTDHTALPATSSADHITQMLKTLHNARYNEAELQTVVKAAEEHFQTEYANLYSRLRAMKETRELIEKQVKALAVAHYNTAKTEDKVQAKKPTPGISISLGSQVQYDAEKAFEWAKKAGVATKPEQLDKDAFEKIALGSPSSFTFVKIVEVPYAKLATDLAKAFAEAE